MFRPRVILPERADARSTHLYGIGKVVACSPGQAGPLAAPNYRRDKSAGDSPRQPRLKRQLDAVLQSSV